MSAHPNTLMKLDNDNQSIQSHQTHLSNFSTHSAPSAIYKDREDLSGQYRRPHTSHRHASGPSRGRNFSVSDFNYSDTPQKSIFSLQNESQSDVCTTLGIEPDRRSLNSPVVTVSSPALPTPLVRSQTHPPPRVPVPVSPVPIRSYFTTQVIGDPQTVRMSVPGYSTSASNHKQQMPAIPSPSQESLLHIPSSLTRSTKLPIVSEEPLVPVVSTQTFQEPKKKAGFFQGLGLFRSESSAQKRHPHESKMPDPRAQTTTATATKTATSKPSVPLHYDSDSKVVTGPSRLRKMKAAHAPVPAAASHPTQPRPPPTPVPAPAPSVAAVPEKGFGSVPNGFGSFRIPSKRYRTMSGASAEANDGTNASASTVFTSPANSTRGPTPKLPPPQRDPQQATYAWRNREEAEALQRGNARRRRPGVHFESYEDHPQAERHKVKYSTRVRERVRR